MCIVPIKLGTFNFATTIFIRICCWVAVCNNQQSSMTMRFDFNVKLHKKKAIPWTTNAYLSSHSPRVYPNPRHTTAHSNDTTLLQLYPQVSCQRYLLFTTGRKKATLKSNFLQAIVLLPHSLELAVTTTSTHALLTWLASSWQVWLKNMYTSH